MQQPPVPLDLPQFEFAGEGVLFDMDTCDHESIPDGTVDAEAAALSVNGDGEDHLLPPHALYPETFSADLLDSERALPFSATAAHAASNPDYAGPSYAETKRQSMAARLKLEQELLGLRSDHRAYMKRVIEIAWDRYHLDSENILPTNPKMEKGVEHGWTTEGVVFAPNVMAGLDDVCPFSSPLCTAHCLNLSGHAESGGAEGVQLNCRRRRTLMYMHARDAFMARIAGLISQRQSDAKNRYAVRLNVMSDLPWEGIKFYTPWGREYATIPRLFEVKTRSGLWHVQFYDYTKNCKRYQNFLTGNFPPNYHLTFSLSEINALYAIYALTQGGSVTVVFDARPESRNRPAEPIPETFCGFPVVDGDLTDLRFEDRKRFGISKNSGVVVGLRLKGKKQRREYNQDRSALAGFVFDAKREYGDDYIHELVSSSERRRLLVSRLRLSRDLPGAQKQRFVGIPEALADEAKRELGF